MSEQDFPYFRRLWKTIVIALLAAAFVPLVLIGGGMYYYSVSVLEEKTLTSLRSEVRHQQKNVDRFLAERIMDLRQVSGTRDLASLTRPGALEEVFKVIQPSLDSRYFTDLGIIDSRGIHRAYAGPYDLISRNYRSAPWFKAVMAHDVYISDVFAGFRRVPHFIIAVKQMVNGETWIIRATIEADFFDDMVLKITGQGTEDAFLVNSEGIFQTTPRTAGELMGSSGIKGGARFKDIRVEENNGQLRMLAWLQNVPWLSVVQLDRSEIFAMLNRVRNLGILVLILGAALIGFTVLLTTNHLVQRLESERRSIHLMDHHLRQANKMTLSLQLFSSFFQEMNEALVNIDSASMLIEEWVDEDSDLEIHRDEIREHLGQIKTEISRSSQTIHQLIGFSLPVDPIISEINVNVMLDNLIELFRRELYFNNVRIVRQYGDSMPVIRADPSIVKQVFQNLIFNALDAIGKGGTITLKTLHQRGHIQVTITDDGPGIALDEIGKIFDPLFTTRPGRLGLGLTICKDLMEKMGGAVALAGRPGKGASLTVTLPVHFKSIDSR